MRARQQQPPYSPGQIFDGNRILKESGLVSSAQRKEGDKKKKGRVDERFPIGFVCQGETPPVNSFWGRRNARGGRVAQLGKNRGIDSATSVCTHVLMREDESETTPKERVMGGVAGAEKRMENGEKKQRR